MVADEPVGDARETGEGQTRARANIACQLCDGDDTRRLFVKNSYNIVKCRQCGLVYINPQPTTSELMAVYAAGYYFLGKGKTLHGYRRDYFARRERRLRRAGKRLKRILRFKSGGRLLDVGCGPGLFLEAAREHFAVSGVEVIPEAAEYASSTLGESGEVMCGDFLQIDVPREGFDVITMYDFVEHVPLPFDNLVKARECLKAGGLLVLGLPNLSSLGAMLKGQNWRGYSIPPEHLFFFTPRTIAALLRKAGFRTLRSPVAQCHPLRDTMYIYALKS